MEELSLKQQVINTHKVFDTEHLDLTGSAAPLPTNKPQGVPHRPLGHGDAQDHRGSVNGVVTTFIPTPVTGAKNSNDLSPVPFTMCGAYPVDTGQMQFNHAVPPVDFPDFDGSSPKLFPFFI